MCIQRKILCILLLTLASCSSTALTPDQRYRPVGMVAVFTVVDWETVLSRVVTPAGYIKWSQFDDPKSAARPALERYLALLAVVSPDNRPDLFEIPPDRTAYWLNAYNAACIYGELLRHQQPPTDSLFEQDHFQFGNRSLSLKQIEYTKLGVQSDPRVVFALTRCTKSSPPMRNEPYQSNRVNFQLNDQAARCLTDARFVVLHNKIASLNQKLILDHQQDFVAAFQSKVNKTGSLLDALRFFAGKHAEQLKATGWDSLPYNGALNTPQ